MGPYEELQMKRTIGSFAATIVAVAIAIASSTAPAGAQQSANFKAPLPGSVYVYRYVIRLGDETRNQQITSTVLQDRSPYKGVSVYRVRSVVERAGKKPVTVVQVYRLKDGNRVAYIDAQGSVLTEYVPHNAQFVWPISVGKKWSRNYEYRSKGRSKKITLPTVHVVAREIVKVSAGTFQTFRIVSKRKANTTTFWYAPKLGVIVKYANTNGAKEPKVYGAYLELLKYKRP